MSDEQQQYWYSVEYDGGPGQFGYIDWQGTAYVGITELEFVNGQWIDPSGLDCSISVAPFGEAGSRLQIEWVAPTSASPNNKLSLAFKTAIDLTQSLPLDQFSAADSFYEVDPAFGSLPPTTSPVRSIARLPR